MMIGLLFAPSIYSMAPLNEIIKKINGFFDDTNAKAVTPILMYWCQQTSDTNINTLVSAADILAVLD